MICIFLAKQLSTRLRYSTPPPPQKKKKKIIIMIINKTTHTHQGIRNLNMIQDGGGAGAVRQKIAPSQRRIKHINTCLYLNGVVPPLYIPPFSQAIAIAWGDQKIDDISDSLNTSFKFCPYLLPRQIWGWIKNIAYMKRYLGYYVSKC